MEAIVYTFLLVGTLGLTIERKANKTNSNQNILIKVLLAVCQNWLKKSPKIKQMFFD